MPRGNQARAKQLQGPFTTWHHIDGQARRARAGHGLNGSRSARPYTHTCTLQLGHCPVLAGQYHGRNPILSSSIGAATELSRRPLSSCSGLEIDESGSGRCAVDGGGGNRRGPAGAVLHGERLSQRAGRRKESGAGDPLVDQSRRVRPAASVGIPFTASPTSVITRPV